MWCAYVPKVILTPIEIGLLWFIFVFEFGLHRLFGLHRFLECGYCWVFGFE